MFRRSRIERWESVVIATTQMPPATEERAFLRMNMIIPDENNHTVAFWNSLAALRGQSCGDDVLR
jgi:hypothetical protein